MVRGYVNHFFFFFFLPPPASFQARYSFWMYLIALWSRMSSSSWVIRHLPCVVFPEVCSSPFFLGLVSSPPLPGTAAWIFPVLDWYFRSRHWAIQYPALASTCTPISWLSVLHFFSWYQSFFEQGIPRVIGAQESKFGLMTLCSQFMWAEPFKPGRSGGYGWIFLPCST